MRKNALVVTHSNKLTEARYSLSINEQRVVLFMISLIQPQDEDFKDYEVAVSDFSELLELNSKDNYARIKKVLRALLSKVLYIPKDDGKGYLMTHWVSSADYSDNEGIINLSFDKKLKPYLLALKEQFTKYRLFTVTHFNSSYSIRIYMLLKQYESIGIREFELSDFKELLGLRDKYPRFADFRKRIITTAKKEFSRKDKAGNYISDITFQLETVTQRRKITKLRFLIEKQKNNNTQIEIPLIKQQENVPLVINEYEAYGINRNITLPKLEMQGEQALINCLNLFKEQTEKLDLTNPSGYLLGMLNNEAGKENQAEKEKEERERIKQQAKKEAEYQKKQQEQREKIERIYTKETVDKYLSELTDAEAGELLTQAKKENPMLSSMMTSLDSPMCLAFLLPKIPDYEKNKETYITKHLTM